MNCLHCHKPIVLVPSAAERAKKDVTGKTAEYYTRQFDYHAACTLELRAESTSALMKYHREQNKGRLL